MLDLVEQVRPWILRWYEERYFKYLSEKDMQALTLVANQLEELRAQLLCQS